MKQNLISLFAAALLLMSCSDGAENETAQTGWSKEYPGVWVNEIGTPEEFNLLTSVDATPQTKMLNKRKEYDFPLDKEKIKYVSKNGRTFITLPANADEQFYGLGLDFKKINQRGVVKQLHMDHYWDRKDVGRTHAPVPFLISSKGYGILFNSARYINAWVTSSARKDSENPPISRDRTTDKKWTANVYADNVEILIPAEGVEVIMFSGESVMDVVSSYNLYCGGGFIPPKWGLGFWHRTPTKYTDKAVITEANSYSEHGFPLDVIGLEPGWHSHAYPCSFEWDSTRFPAPKSFIDSLSSKNIKVNLWCNPYISENSSLYPQLEKYAATHTVWCGDLVDYTIPEAKDIFVKHISEKQLDLGISGYKIDEIDGNDAWLWPDVTLFPSGLDGEQMRNTYGNIVLKTIYDAYKVRNQRTYGMARAANVGASKLPYVIYNDTYSHRDYITALISASFIGVHWTPEVRASQTGEEWLRRMQTTCFSPLALINAWANRTKPWDFPEVYEQCQDVAQLRMRLLPYIYSAFAEYYFTGKPAFRAMELTEGYNPVFKATETKLNDTDNAYAEAKFVEVTDQYMMGDNILVAPLFTTETERKVVLPEGKWFDFYDGTFVGEGETITIKDAEDHRIPLFVRDGAIIPMIKTINNTSEWSKNKLDLDVRVYGTKPSTFRLYDDDGETFDYENGAYTIKELSTDQSVKDIVSNSGWSYANINWIDMNNPNK